MHTIILNSDSARKTALQIVSSAPAGYHVEVKPEPRTLDQNKLMWALLTEISVARPKGYKVGTPHQWKCRFLNALGFECLMDIGLDNEPYAMGMSTSNLSKKEFSGLLELIFKFGAENDIDLSKHKQAADKYQEPPQPDTSADHVTRDLIG